MSNSFDFEQFKANAIEQLKAGVPLSGKEGVLAPYLINHKIAVRIEPLNSRFGSFSSMSCKSCKFKKLTLSLYCSMERY